MPKWIAIICFYRKGVDIPNLPTKSLSKQNGLSKCLCFAWWGYAIDFRREFFFLLSFVYFLSIDAPIDISHIWIFPLLALDQSNSPDREWLRRFGKIAKSWIHRLRCVSHVSLTLADRNHLLTKYVTFRWPHTALHQSRHAWDPNDSIFRWILSENVSPHWFDANALRWIVELNSIVGIHNFE